MLICFHAQENTSISIKLVSKCLETRPFCRLKTLIAAMRYDIEWLFNHSVVQLNYTLNTYIISNKYSLRVTDANLLHSGIQTFHWINSSMISITLHVYMPNAVTYTFLQVYLLAWFMV